MCASESSNPSLSLREAPRHAEAEQQWLTLGAARERSRRAAAISHDGKRQLTSAIGSKMDASQKGLADAEFRLTPGLAGGLEKVQELQKLLYAARDSLARGEALSAIERQRLDGALDALMVFKKSKNSPLSAPTSESSTPIHLTSNAKEHIMAKSQKRSNREARKPKAEKSKKQNASNPSQKPAALGIVTLKS